MASEAVRGTVRVAPVERRDAWWAEPLAIVVGLSIFVAYATWILFQNQYYYSAPYISPFYSPCIVSNCLHSQVPPAFRWAFSPMWVIFWIPIGFRLTCYYYRKGYYRSFFWAPPACAVPDARRHYKGETIFPFIIQNIHRYFFWLALPVVFFLWWDVFDAFRFPTGWGIGVGTGIMLVNVIFLTLYSFSCHAWRHICGGALDVLSSAKLRLRLWRWTSFINEHHQLIAWCSLTSVALTDVYIRLLAMGVFSDPHWVF
ncbi:MAG TPA: succinate dehydrogenase [Chloroflexota bacterium]|nr:succinate dehydrogenase [Chloroflexota bacterium]